MSPVYQNVYPALGSEGSLVQKGNSMEACLATVLDVPLKRIPVLSGTPSSQLYWQHLQVWLTQIGLATVWFDGRDCSEVQNFPCYIAIGNPKRRVDLDSKFHDMDHAVVMGFGKLLHDPYQSTPEHGGLRNYSSYMILGVADTSLFRDWLYQPIPVDDSHLRNMDHNVFPGLPPSVSLDPAIGFPLGQQSGRGPHFVTGMSVVRDARVQVEPGKSVDLKDLPHGVRVSEDGMFLEIHYWVPVKKVEELLRKYGVQEPIPHTIPQDTMYPFPDPMQTLDELRTSPTSEQTMRDVESEGQRAYPRTIFRVPLTAEASARAAAQPKDSMGFPTGPTFATKFSKKD